MHILITGGTGLIGQRLCKALIARGDQVSVLSRRPQQVAILCGSQVQALGSLNEWTSQEFDAVINLAGAPIVDAAWSAARKQEIMASRVGYTQRLVIKMASVPKPPSVFLSGSAIGFYGDDATGELDESKSAGSDFSAILCRDWEAAAQRYESEVRHLHGDQSAPRIVLLRTGLVLDPRGGVLKKMLLPFQLGIGGKLGDGRQIMSWIHHADYLRAVLRLLDDANCRGPYNLAAPHAVSNAEFSSTLAKTLHRPALFTTPAWVLRMLLGERADLILRGQHVVPKALQACAFQFEYPELAPALAEILQ
jgi:uncharacterized protein (TIGR01777 family)